MNSVPFMQDEAALRKLANRYLVAFWLGMLVFYITLIQEGYEPQLALLTCCAAALACLLQRGATRCRELSLNRALAATIVPLAAFLIRVNEMIESDRGSNSSIGLMLISFKNLEDGDAGEVPAAVVRAIRGHVRRETGSPLFQINSTTLAVVESGAQVVDRLDQLSEEIQGLFRAQRVALPGLTYARLTIGIALGGKGVSSGAELFATARAAVELGEVSTREIFVRQV